MVKKKKRKKYDGKWDRRAGVCLTHIYDTHKMDVSFDWALGSVYYIVHAHCTHTHTASYTDIYIGIIL